MPRHAGKPREMQKGQPARPCCGWLAQNVEAMTNDAMSPLLPAAIEATEEAV
jgi:hypothetical protein